MSRTFLHVSHFVKWSIYANKRQVSEKSGGIRKRELPSISWVILHLVSTKIANFCFPEEISKLAVIASNINRTKEYAVKSQYGVCVGSKTFFFTKKMTHVLVFVSTPFSPSTSPTMTTETHLWSPLQNDKYMMLFFFFFLSKTCDWITEIPKRIAWRVFAKTEFYELISRVSRENEIERSTLLKLWKAGEHNWSALSRAGENRDVDSQWTQEKEKKCTSHKTFFITNKIFVTPRGV